MRSARVSTFRVLASLPRLFKLLWIDIAVSPRPFRAQDADCSFGLFRRKK
jgi:hypothetical protein